LRPSWVEVDLGAVTHNVGVISAAIAPAGVCAVVKANAYGHGDVPIAEAALAGGASQLAVALVEEAIRLREAGVEAPILLLSEPEPRDAGEVIAWDLLPTVYRLPFASALAAVAPRPYPVHVKVDTGMHRVGAGASAAHELLAFIGSEPALELEAVWTHFAVSESDESFTLRQVSLFDDFVDAAEIAGSRPKYRHAANTAAALLYPETRYTFARIGLGIYGMRPAPDVAPELDLRPAMRVTSRVSMVRRLPAGARPSYGRNRPLAADSFVATVPIGYADGVSRRLADANAEVLIGGRRHPFAGAITMDQIVVEVGDTPVGVGDEVVLLGRQGDAEITADEWASRLDSINYEIVCDFGPRLPRRYHGAASDD
jgi:alanine racemase